MKDVVFLQRFLRFGGYYEGKIDGIQGNLTNKAYENFVKDSKVVEGYGTLDDRSESNILTLLVSVQDAARQFLKKTKEMGLDVRVISGTRSYAEQNELYAQGRTKEGNIVTKAKGGYSWHNFGMAFDIGVFEGKRFVLNDEPYLKIGRLADDFDLEWGGNWRFKDIPHYQLKTTFTIDELREKFES